MLGPESAVETLAFAHMQKLALILSSNQEDIEYYSSADYANAGAFSRLPGPITDNEEYRIIYFSAVPFLPRDIQEATRRDPIFVSCTRLFTEWLAKSHRLIWRIVSIYVSKIRTFCGERLFTIEFQSYGSLDFEILNFT